MSMHPTNHENADVSYHIFDQLSLFYNTHMKAILSFPTTFEVLHWIQARSLYIKKMLTIESSLMPRHIGYYSLCRNEQNCYDSQGNEKNVC